VDAVNDRTFNRSVEASIVAWPAPCVVEEPQAIDELVELVEIPLRDPVTPCDAQVLYVGGHRRQRGLAPQAGEVLPLLPGEVCEVGSVGSTVS
jgi:hypothetical protein